MTFGARPFNFGGGVVFPFEGTLDEIYVYNRVLDDTEIAQLVLDTLTDIAPPVRSNLMPDTSQPLGTTSVDLTFEHRRERHLPLRHGAGHVVRRHGQRLQHHGEARPTAAPKR